MIYAIGQASPSMYDVRAQHAELLVDAYLLLFLLLSFEWVRLHSLF